MVLKLGIEDMNEPCRGSTQAREYVNMARGKFGKQTIEGSSVEIAWDA